MHRLAPVALATLLAASAPALLHAQTPFTPLQLTTPFTDPANLRGERVSPRTGRELPIDGGLDANNQPGNALGLQQLLRKLSTRASILNIVAHPDDEDGGMLTLYARGYGARVADLSLTRGEGGQNAMTGDFEDALGLLRTQELLANDRYTGVTQMFGTEVDFGFSKTKAESFSKWGHERVLYDAVRAIRLYRPLVITATFIGNPTDGHGQHQVSGEIAQEAFVAAGDPNVFPELTREGILPWQPLKMYARVPTYAISAKGLFDYATGQYVPAAFTNYVTGVTSTTPPSTDIVIHEGATDPLLTTCAAIPADLPTTLRAASSLSSFRNAGGSAFPSATDCRPLSYVQFARIGLGLQRSQIGPGVRNAPSGAFDVPYHLYGSRICDTSRSSALPQDCHPERSAQRAVEGPATPPVPASPLVPSSLVAEPSFFDGIDTSLDGILSLDKNAPLSDAAWKHITQSIMEAQRRFDPQHPETIAPFLADALANVNLEIDLLNKNENPSIARANILHELRIKRVQLNDAVALSLGIKIDATSEDTTVTARWGKRFHATISARPNSGCVVDNTWLQNAAGAESEDHADTGQKVTPATGDLADTFLIAGSTKTPFDSDFTAVLTRPYFERKDIEQPVYDLRDASLRNAAQSPPAFTANAKLSCRGTEIMVRRIVHFAYEDQQPVMVTPPLNILLSSHAQVLPTGVHHLAIEVTDHSFGSITFLTGLCMPTGCTMPPFTTVDHDVRSRIYHIDVPVQLRQSPFIITAQGQSGYFDGSNPRVNAEGFRPVGYGSLPRTNFYTPATDRIVPVDLKLPPANKRRIGYLEGTGDAVPAALASIGLKPTMLTVADLTPEKLKAFDTVILGVRTYNAHPDLHGAPTQALLDFARSGGNVVVQYQTHEFTAADAPFPLSLGSDEKVVDETDPVEILHPQSTLFTTPNHILSSDFDHFIEERGHGFLGSWDPRYTALTETHDPGQAPQKGGLITVQMGRGRWTYCAFALYRQLPEAVPGTFRLFTNLLNP